VDSRAGLDDVEGRKFLNLPGLEIRPMGRPVRSQSLCRLRYLDSSKHALMTTEDDVFRGSVQSGYKKCWAGQKSRSRLEENIEQ
jgi:hypothetical protein